MTIGIIFVVLSLVLLIFLAYKGISVMVVAPLMALLAYAGSTVFIGGSGTFLCNLYRGVYEGCRNIYY